MEKYLFSILYAITMEAFVATPVAYKLNTGPKHIVHHLTVVKFEISFFNLKIFIHCAWLLLILFWMLSECDLESELWMVSIPYPTCSMSICTIQANPWSMLVCYVGNIFQFTDSEFHVVNILLQYNQFEGAVSERCHE